MKKRYIIMILLLVLIDQLSKLFIVSNFNVYDEWIIIKDFFKFEYVQNTGISFGLFSGGRILIIIASIAVIGFMIYDMFQEESKIHYFSCMLILSGAIGNLIDRIIRGYVVDFISFTIFGHKMAIFNIADICVVIGVILYILLMFFEGRSKDEEDSSEE